VITKSIVLARGDIIDGKITVPEAKKLMTRFLDCYTNLTLYEEYPQRFNHNSEAFKFDEYVEQYRTSA
jgi:hypothetical protein